MCSVKRDYRCSLILEVIEIYTTQLEMRKAHILNSATVLSSVIGMGGPAALYQQL